VKTPDNGLHPPVLVIVNPSGGGGQVGRAWLAVERRLVGSGISFDVASPCSPADCIDTTRRALRSGVDTIVAAGGDGTANLVVNGFFDGGAPINPQARLGIIPLGTGNDLARTLGLPPGEAAVPSLLRAPRWIDVGIATLRDIEGAEERRYFLNFAAVGLPVQVVQQMARRPMGGGGFLPYLIASLVSLPAARSIDVQISLDDGERASLQILALGVANGAYFGGGMKLNPNAIIDDGRLEVIALKKTSLIQVAYALFRIYSGSHLALSKIKAWQARVIRIQSARPFDAGVDGDAFPWPVTSLEVRVIRQAIQILA
jgi:diacylglycerol kinase (ATP)